MLLGVDIESTGLDPSRDRIVQVGFSHRLWKHRQMIDPGRRISVESRAVHGISDEDVTGAPAFADVAPWIVATLTGGDRVVAYNAEFDARMINAELERARHVYRLHPSTMIDPLRWARRLWPHERHRLADICDHLGLRRGGHRADDDAEAARLIVLKLIERGQVPSDLSRLVEEQHNPRQPDLWRDPLPGEEA